MIFYLLTQKLTEQAELHKNKKNYLKLKKIKLLVFKKLTTVFAVLNT